MISYCIFMFFNEVFLNISKFENIKVKRKHLELRKTVLYKKSLVKLLNKRFYSIKRSERKYREFWSQVNSKKKNNITNPHFLAERFIENYPDRELAKSNINLNLIKSILSLHVPDFSLTLEEFNILRSIQPISLNYPFEESSSLLGKPLRGGKGRAGVYLFRNKVNGDIYVGSSINLALRLKDGYFRYLPILGKRKIEVAIREYGLANFNLDIFLIPSVMNKNIKNLHYLVLSLEQILILELNPKLNEIRVAGSNPGYITSKNLKKSYLHDAISKEVIYIEESRKNLAKILGCHVETIKRYLSYKKKLYLKRFIIADTILNEQGYTINLKSLQSLKAYLNEIRLERKKYLTKVVPSREETNLKLCKKVPPRIN